MSTVRAQAVSGGTPADRLLIVRFDLQPFALETSEICVPMILGDSMRVAIARLVFGGAAALFLAAMLFASAVPDVRASRFDPAETLKDA